MIEKELERKRCTGCSACYNSCPCGCIQMKENNEGFFYPEVNETKCKKCKVCLKKCPVLNNKSITIDKQKIIAAYSKDENNRMKSSSGGCFGEFANYVLDNDGVVFGVGFDDNFNVIHKCVTKKENLQELKGSKYVQSNVGEIYKDVKRNLDDGKLVLFSGTPCQVAGLNALLGKVYDNLYTLDIVCHGVPSQKVFDKYLNKYGKKNDIKTIEFRDKTKGWKQFSMKIVNNKNDSFIILASDDEYMKAFLSNICLRESCYNCEFRTSQADLSIGDFWGVEHVNPQLNDNKGISIVLINNAHGKYLFNKCKDKFTYEENIDKEKIIEHNPSIVRSVIRPRQRTNFFKNFDDEDFKTLVKKNIPKKSLIKRMLRKIYRSIKAKR